MSLDNKPEVLAAFKEAFSEDWLSHLENTKALRDIAELMWLAFAYGFEAGSAA
jgi:hypothetical protein